MSDKGWIPSSAFCRVRLSFRLSRKDFSPRTAPVRFRPALVEPDPEPESGTAGGLDAAAAAVSIVNPIGLGDLPRPCCSSPTQSAGVGGTGPSAVTPLGGGLLVGGETTGSLVLLRL